MIVAAGRFSGCRAGAAAGNRQADGLNGIYRSITVAAL